MKVKISKKQRQLNKIVNSSEKQKFCIHYNNSPIDQSLCKQNKTNKKSTSAGSKSKQKHNQRQSIRNQICKLSKYVDKSEDYKIRVDSKYHKHPTSIAQIYKPNNANKKLYANKTGSQHKSIQKYNKSWSVQKQKDTQNKTTISKYQNTKFNQILTLNSKNSLTLANNPTSKYIEQQQRRVQKIKRYLQKEQSEQAERRNKSTKLIVSQFSNSKNNLIQSLKISEIRCQNESKQHQKQLNDLRMHYENLISKAGQQIQVLRAKIKQELAQRVKSDIKCKQNQILIQGIKNKMAQTQKHKNKLIVQIQKSNKQKQYIKQQAIQTLFFVQNQLANNQAKD